MFGRETTRNLKIAVSHPKYRRQGTLYIRVYARPSLTETFFGDPKFRYLISYRLEGTLEYLDNHSQKQSNIEP